MENIDFLLVMEGEMDFGFAVSDYEIVTGSYGKTIKIDTSIYLPDKINWVQGENASEGKSEVITSPVSSDILQSYMEDENCPDIAFSFEGSNLTIFFKNDVYDTRFAYDGYRYPQYMDASQTLDCKQDDFELVKSYISESVYEDNGLMVPYKIRQTIQELEQELEDEI